MLHCQSPEGATVIALGKPLLLEPSWIVRGEDALWSWHAREPRYPLCRPRRVGLVALWALRRVWLMSALRITEALRAAIVTGELEPGQVYSAPRLGAQFGVSATPVREAMLDLLKEGLVRTVRNKGFEVLAPSPVALHDILEVRQLLEVPTFVALPSVAFARPISWCCCPLHKRPFELPTNTTLSVMSQQT